MAPDTIKVSKADIARLVEDVAAIKAAVAPTEDDPEGELTDWAKEQLALARCTKKKVPHDEVKRLILAQG